jgi:hypothetical protein
VLFGNWLTDTTVLSDVVYRAYYRSILEGLAANPLIYSLSTRSELSFGLQLLVPLFGCSFVLILVGPLLRKIYFTAAILFHAANAILLAVTFTPILIVYGLGVNWHRLLLRARSVTPFRLQQVKDLKKPSAEILAIVLALAVALDWNTLGVARAVSTTGGILDWLTVWYVAAPCAVVGLAGKVVRMRGGSD